MQNLAVENVSYLDQRFLKGKFSENYQNLTREMVAVQLPCTTVTHVQSWTNSEFLICLSKFQLQSSPDFFKKHFNQALMISVCPAGPSRPTKRPPGPSRPTKLGYQSQVRCKAGTRTKAGLL